LLGIHVPTWKLLAPAILIHGMTNFRGMKVSMRIDLFRLYRCLSLIVLMIMPTMSFSAIFQMEFFDALVRNTIISFECSRFVNTTTAVKEILC
jgi:hypothetical protein